MNIVDLSVFRKEDMKVISLTGEEYIIPGNVSTEFYIALYDAYQQIIKTQKEDEENFDLYLNLLKEIDLQILKLDTSKNCTMDTINTQFNDLNVLRALLDATMKHVNEATSDPNSSSPTSN